MMVAIGPLASLAQVRPGLSGSVACSHRPESFFEGDVERIDLGEVK